MKKENIKVEETAPKKARGFEQGWNFPKLGLTVQAATYEEALKKANKTIKN